MNKSDSQSIFINKNVLIGVSGSIAAYKIPELIRLFVKKGANVKVILTKDAVNFVTPLTISTVSKNRPYVDFVDATNNTWYNHVKLAMWADFFVISPATANTIAKMATGICDNILLATFLSATCPIFCAPAMDRDMYLHSATIKNIDIIRKRGVEILDVEKGELASGLHGFGRMCSLNKIIENIQQKLSSAMPFFGKRILITAGPTYEKIDPVRFIGNFSTGKMGCELAKKAALYGASVDLVLGPSEEEIRHPNINLFNIQSASQMLDECACKFEFCDIAIFSAAVSDFRPKYTLDNKLKEKAIVIKTSFNKDIIATLSKKKKKQFVVGFALETENEEENAINKLVQKDLDLIVLNSLNDKCSGFGYDTNKIKIIDRELSIQDYPLMKKSELSGVILDKILLKQQLLSLSKS